MSVETDRLRGGPARCPSPCEECSDGKHHFSDAMISFASPDDDDADGVSEEQSHAAALAGCDTWYECKHCDAWREATDADLDEEGPDEPDFTVSLDAEERDFLCYLLLVAEPLDAVRPRACAEAEDAYYQRVTRARELLVQIGAKIGGS